MSCLVWTSATDNVDFGDTILVLKCVDELARVSNGSHEYEYLASLEDNLEQSVPPEWWEHLQEEAHKFLSRYGEYLSVPCTLLLEKILNHTGLQE